MIVRRRSVLSKLAFAVLVVFALASHFNGAAVHAYKIVQYRIRYPTTVNDDEVPNTDANYQYGSEILKQQPSQQAPPFNYEAGQFTDYDYEQQQQQPLQSQQQSALSIEPSRFSSNIALNGYDRLSKYKPNNADSRVENGDDDKMQEQVQSILKSLYEIERQKQYNAVNSNNDNAPEQSDQQISSSQNVLSSMPKPMKKVKTIVDPLENELFAQIQNKPLEDAETMDKSSADTDNVDDGDNNNHYSRPINRESVSNQNYAGTEIFKRKLISQQAPNSALIKSEPNQANFENYRQISNKFIQSPDSNGSSNQTFLASMSDIYFVAMVICVSSVAICSVIGAGYCFYKVQQNNRQSADVEFPAYGVIGPNVNGDCGLNSLNGSGPNSKCSSPPADRKLTQAAQMYHYQHQKEQMISNERNVVRVSNHGTANSDLDSDEENEDGEYTVYECPGLAPTGEMEVKNPLFQDDLTPMSSPSVLNGKPQKK